jgi:hypothetical protein
VCFVVLHSSQDHLRIGTRDLNHPISCQCKKHLQLARQERHLQHAFLLDVLMVPASVLTVAAGGECLLCGGFSRGKTIRFESLEFIADHFGGMSLSPMWDGSNAVVMVGHCPSAPIADQDWGHRRGVPHGPERGTEDRPPLSLEARRGGHSRFNHDHTTAGELSD